MNTLIGFNRTSFQQQLKHHFFNGLIRDYTGFNRTSFQQQLKQRPAFRNNVTNKASIVHPFNNN